VVVEEDQEEEADLTEAEAEEEMVLQVADNQLFQQILAEDKAGKTATYRKMSEFELNRYDLYLNDRLEFLNKCRYLFVSTLHNDPMVK
jgi:hypothetical protein